MPRRKHLTSRVLAFMAVALLTSTVVLAQTDPSTATQKRGIELYRSGNLSAAADVFSEVTKTNKADSVSWHYLGLTRLKQDKLKDAAKALETSLELAPGNAQARADLGYVLLQLGQYGEAYREARHAVWVDRNLAAAHYVFGLVHHRQRAPLDALERANEAIRLDPNLAGAHLLRSLALTNLAAEKHTQAEPFSVLPNNTPPISPAKLSEQRRLAHAEMMSNLREATSSLETYLKLETADAGASWQGQLSALKVFSQSLAALPGGKPSEEAPIWPHRELTTKVKFHDIPEPSRPKPAREAGVFGTVLLWVLFGSDGRVGQIVILRGLPKGVTEEAITAAKRIKYDPGAVLGRPVSTTLTIEYNF